MRLIYFLTTLITLASFANDNTGSTNNVSPLAAASTGVYTDENAWLAAVPDNLESNGAFQFQTRDNNLPNVLIIGSTISFGYTQYVQSELNGTANVYRIPTTAGTTTTGNNRLDGWLDNDNWDLIYFHFGMEDLKLSGGSNAVPVATYQTQLETFVTSLQAKTSAKLVFANTTYIQANVTNRNQGDDATYNNAAQTVMNNNNVTIDDLYTWSVDNSDKLLTNNITFTIAGRQAQGTHIANTITTELSDGAPNITALTVTSEQQGEQGVEQLIVRGTVNFSGDANDLTYSYTITDGTATLTPSGNEAILSDITSSSVTIQLEVEDNDMNTTTRTVTYTPVVIDGSQLYTDSATWTNAVSPSLRSHESFTFQNRDENLPKVLIIGNSISYGYTVYVQQNLAGICNVNRIPVNAGATNAGISNLDFWLANEDWDLIQFNFGLHDLKYLLNGKLDLNGTQVNSPNDYATKLETIANKLLNDTDAKIIFANTTVVPQGSEGRIPGDEVTYNAKATEVMNRLGIRINDLYTLNVNNPSDQLTANVHFNTTGKQRQAQQLTDIIKEELNLNNNLNAWQTNKASKWDTTTTLGTASSGFVSGSLVGSGVWAYLDLSLEAGTEYQINFKYEISNSAGEGNARIIVAAHEGTISKSDFSSLNSVTYSTDVDTPAVESGNGMLVFTPTQEDCKIVVLKNGAGGVKASAKISDLELVETSTLSSGDIFNKSGILVQVVDNAIVVNNAELQQVYNSLGQVIENKNLESGIYFVSVLKENKLDIVKVLK